MRVRGWCGAAVVLALWSAISPVAVSRAQTLARPGWAGSGVRVEAWWKSAVFYEVSPGGPPVTTGAEASRTALERVTARLEDLQTLGADAILLRGIDRTGAASASDPGAGRIDPAYGTTEQFDRLMQEAGGRRMRVVVELSAGEPADRLAAAARFWLSRGATGLYLSGAANGDALRTARGVLRSYVGERVLIGDAGTATAGQENSDAAPPQASRRGSDAFARGANRTGADLTMVHLRGLAQGAVDVPALRSSIQQIAGAGTGSLVALESGGREQAPDLSKAKSVALLSAGTALAIGSDAIEADRTAPAPPAGNHPVQAESMSLLDWYRHILGLHRGNSTLRSGNETLLNHDAEGALVCVWRGRGAGGQVVVAISNLTPKPLHLVLTDDIAGMHLRGSFLRTLLRSDRGMGAMPLRAVDLPAYGVYIGELGR